NITQEQLAEKLYITDRAVSKWERGLSLPDADKMLDLCNILDINVNELLNGERIDMKDSLNEHIKPKDLYPNETMEYKNIIVSCAKDSNICGPKKQNYYDKNLFVSPLDEDSEEHFAFFPNGDIVGLTEKGDYTIKILGLDSYKLKQARAAVYQVCQYCDEELLNWYLEMHEGKLEPFIDVIRYYKKSS
ncbi:MAG: helix-turn-helix domain-containing protein, partial [Lachnospiraceae bacterium]|nr:helix-turn-helix domain-containing protein [Lachnospiraceae bacterium]